MYRKEINILRKIVHQVGFIYKFIQGCTVNKTQKTRNCVCPRAILDTLQMRNNFLPLAEIEPNFITSSAYSTVSTSNELSCLLPVVSSLTNIQIYLNACMTL